MDLYVGDTNYSKLNRILTDVRHWCVAPSDRKKSFTLPDVDDPGATSVMLDSGAFPDVRRGVRLAFDSALDRQLDLESKSRFVAARIVSYDLLIDEKLKDGRRVKERWEVDEARRAVDVTIAAAQYLASMRAALEPRQLVMSAQGVTPDQYEECARAILDMMRPGDCFGFGGWCIIGQRRGLVPAFIESVERVAPLIAARGVKDAHVFGVAYMPALSRFGEICRDHGIHASTDTTRFYNELVFGYQFDPTTGKSPRVSPKSICNNETGAANIRAARDYIARL